MAKGKKKILSLVLATVISTMSLTTVTNASETHQGEVKDFTISNPYESVDWTNDGQYKANFHSHSTNSDGGSLLYNMVEDHYAKDFDILAMTDHNYVNLAWDKADKGAMSTQRMNAIIDGTAGKAKGLTDGGEYTGEFEAARGNGMTMIQYSDEQSLGDHVNTFFVNYNNKGDYVNNNNTGFSKMEYSIKYAEDNGGISHINHPGRYTGASKKYDENGAAISNDPNVYMKYVDLLNKYKSCVGMEIINKKDGDSASDRILWDNILTQTLGQENPRNVWGFSNDDCHSLSAVGYSYNWMLMSSNTAENTRKSMENGTFYSVAKVSVRELGADFVAEGEPPRISNIETDNNEDTITIEGYDYNEVEWISEGKIIATGNTIDLNEYEDSVGVYVRAQLKGKGGIAFTQAFPVSSEYVSANKTTASINGDDLSIVDLNDEVSYTVSVKDVINTNVLKATLSYDAENFEFVSAESVLLGTIFTSVNDENGKVSAIVGTSNLINSTNEIDAVKFTFKVKATAKLGKTSLVLNGVDFAQYDGENAKDLIAGLGTNVKETEIYSYKGGSDINRDGKVSLADLSIALANFTVASSVGDVNKDGMVNTKDFILITSYM